MESLRRISIAFLALAVSACSDSVLFSDSEVTVPAIPAPPPPPTAGPVTPNEGIPPQVMTFDLDPDPSLNDGAVLQSLFAGQAVDAFQVQNSEGLQIDLAMESASVDITRGENHVRIKLTLSVKGTALSREYASYSDVTLRNSGAKDLLIEGELRAVDGRGGTLFISGDRTASSTQDTAQRNAWRGNLLNENKLRLGRFNGFAH